MMVLKAGKDWEHLWLAEYPWGHILQLKGHLLLHEDLSDSGSKSKGEGRKWFLMPSRAPLQNMHNIHDAGNSIVSGDSKGTEVPDPIRGTG